MKKSSLLVALTIALTLFSSIHCLGEEKDYDYFWSQKEAVLIGIEGTPEASGIKKSKPKLMKIPKEKVEQKKKIAKSSKPAPEKKATKAPLPEKKRSETRIEIERIAKKRALTLSEYEEFFDAKMGEALAREARKQALRTGTIGKCYRSVSKVVKRVTGVVLSGVSAYEARGQLEASTVFREINISPEQLPFLHEGAIVVWGETAESENGHISITVECKNKSKDERKKCEASDHIEKQRIELRGNTNFSVFVPVSTAISKIPSSEKDATNI